MANRIKEIRKGQNMTQVALAAKSGISRATIWMLERDCDKVTTSDTLCKIAAALNVPVGTLFTDSNS